MTDTKKECFICERPAGPDDGGEKCVACSAHLCDECLETQHEAGRANGVWLSARCDGDACGAMVCPDCATYCRKCAELYEDPHVFCPACRASYLSAEDEAEGTWYCDDEHEADEADHECVRCNAITSTLCACGSAYVCGKCAEAPYPLKEWFEVIMRCDLCDKPLCANCVAICFDCANKGIDQPIHCADCCNCGIHEVECTHHLWTVCGKAAPKCGECRANRNYDGRHGGP